MGWWWDRHYLGFGGSKVVTLVCDGICRVQSLRLLFRTVSKVIYVIRSRCLFCYVCVFGFVCLFFIASLIKSKPKVFSSF